MDYGPHARRTLRRWLDATGHTSESIAAELGVAPSLVRGWVADSSHLPHAVVPALAAMDRPDVWVDALTRQIAVLRGDEPTDDHLRPEQRALRVVAGAGGALVEIGAALADGRIDAAEAPRVVATLRGLRGEIDRTIDGLAAVRVVGVRR